MRRRLLTSILLASALGCSAIVKGKLNDKPERPDGMVPPARCTSDPECQTGGPCNGMETCNTATMMCEPGTPVAPPPAAGGATAVPCDVNGDGTIEGVCVGAVCMNAVCGDGVVSPPEECDDRANTNPLDGCTATCRVSCRADGDCNNDCTTGGRCALNRCSGATPANEGGACRTPDGGSGTCMTGTCRIGG